MVFAEGVVAQYKSHIGVIRFISDNYITLCINTFPNEKVRDVCILIYRDQYKDIKLIKESEK
jgi:hypothetical protein